MPLFNSSGRFQDLISAHDHPEGPFVAPVIRMMLLRPVAERVVDFLRRGVSTDAQYRSRINGKVMRHAWFIQEEQGGIIVNYISQIEGRKSSSHSQPSRFLAR